LLYTFATAISPTLIFNLRSAVGMRNVKKEGYFPPLYELRYEANTAQTP